MLELRAREIRNRHTNLFDTVEGFRDWIGKRRLMIRPGIPFGFKGHEYLAAIVGIIDEVSRVIVVEKSAQVGISTTFLAESFYLSDRYSAKSLYYFPTDSDIKDFSLDRADVMLRSTGYLRDIARGTNNVGLKHVGGGTLYFRGMWSKRRVKSVDGDALYLDELDEADPENVQFARDRLLHSELRLERYFSQPSVPDYGIDALFKKGTQDFWFVKCTACGHEQALELELEDGRLPRNFLPVPRKWKGGRFPTDQVFYRGCLKCREPLDMGNGRMVSRYPEREIKSIHLSQLYSQQHPNGGFIEDQLMNDLLNARTSHEIKRVVISIIGNAYVDNNLQPINETVIRGATGDHGLYSEGDWCFMGVDQGDMLSVVIAEGYNNRLKVVFAEETPDWQRLYKLMEQYDVRHCLIDALPNKSDAKRFAASFRGRVTIQYFKQSFKQSEEPFVDGNQDAMVPSIMVDRDETLDDTAYAMKSGEITLPRTGIPVVDDLHRHLKNLVKEKDEAGRVHYKKNVENHYGMALNSCRLALLHAPVVPFVGVMPVGGRLGDS